MELGRPREGAALEVDLAVQPGVRLARHLERCVAHLQAAPVGAQRDHDVAHEQAAPRQALDPHRNLGIGVAQRTLQHVRGIGRQQVGLVGVDVEAIEHEVRGEAGARVVRAAVHLERCRAAQVGRVDPDLRLRELHGIAIERQRARDAERAQPPARHGRRPDVQPGQQRAEVVGHGVDLAAQVHRPARGRQTPRKAQIGLARQDRARLLDGNLAIACQPQPQPHPVGAALAVLHRGDRQIDLAAQRPRQGDERREVGRSRGRQVAQLEPFGLQAKRHRRAGPEGQAQLTLGRRLGEQQGKLVELQALAVELEPARNLEGLVQPGRQLRQGAAERVAHDRHDRARVPARQGHVAARSQIVRHATTPRRCSAAWPVAGRARQA